MRAAMAFVWLLGSIVSVQPLATGEMRTTEAIALPAPRADSGVSVEHALRERRSVREFRPAPLTLEEIAQLLWAAQGISGDGLRTAPSAGALFPLELYVVADAGIRRYLPAQHALAPVAAGDRRRDLASAALGQDCIADASIVLVITAVPGRTSGKYGTRGQRYVHLEVGHAAQNVLLQATALGLAAVPVGAFDDAKVADVLALPKGEAPLYLIALGRPR